MQKILSLISWWINFARVLKFKGCKFQTCSIEHWILLCFLITLFCAVLFLEHWSRAAAPSVVVALNRWWKEEVQHVCIHHFKLSVNPLFLLQPSNSFHYTLLIPVSFLSNVLNNIFITFLSCATLKINNI